MTTDDHSIDLDNEGGLPAGTILSDTYEIVRQIGMGGMAEVYRARNIHTDEPVAIKLVLPEFARDQTNHALFKKEATVLSRLHHDAIVRYHTYTVEKTLKRPYLVMEFVDGVALSEFIKKAPLDAASTRLLISRIASGLEVAHEADVIHRDLSPDNVILPEGNVSKTKIVDFGIAKAAKIGDGTLLGGKFAGKYNFVSPEQLGLAGGEVTGQSDIYSLGLIAAAAQLGHPVDMGGSQLEVLEKRRVVPDLSGLDPSLRPIVTAMLQPLPENRPRTMADVIAMLEAPVQKALPDTGTVFGAEMPYVPPAARDIWGDRPTERSTPPRPADSWPKTERSTSPSAWPGERGAPQQGSWPEGGADPSAPASWPPAERPFPSIPVGGGSPEVAREPVFAPATPLPGGNPFETSPATTTSPRSESPFGPGPASTAPPTFGKPRGATTAKPKSTRSGGGGGLWVGLVLVVLLLGGGGVFYLMGGLALLNPTKTDVVPINPPATSTVVPATTEPTVATTAAHVTTTTAPPLTTTTVAETTTVVPPTATIDLVAKHLGWLKDYQFSKCQFATPITVADSAMTIEGFGNAEGPFEQMLADFTRDNGFEPNIGIRVINDAQCAVTDFLREVQPLTGPGPTMTLSTDELPSGGSLQGNLSTTDGWTTDLLLVDYLGAVQNVTVFMTPTGGGASFALPPLTSKSANPVPMMIVAISNKGGLNTTRIVQAHAASQIFPIILREIQSKGAGVSVAVKYFRLDGAPNVGQ